MGQIKFAVLLVLISATVGFSSPHYTHTLVNKTDVYQAQTEAEWVKFTSPEGRFAVLLPHEPKFEKTSATEANPITNYRYSALGSGYGFICEYFDAPSTGEDLQKFLDNTRDGIVSGASATLVGEQKISLNRYPGRELTLAFTAKENAEITARTRIYLVGKRLYSLTFLHVKSMDAVRTANFGKKFFSSFELKPGV